MKSLTLREFIQQLQAASGDNLERRVVVMTEDEDGCTTTKPIKQVSSEHPSSISIWVD